MSRLVLLTAVLGVALIPGCSDSAPLTPSPPGEPLPLVRLREAPYPFAYYSGLDDSVRAVVRDEAVWKGIWDGIWRDSSQPPLPQVDFGREMLVVAALGTRPSSGYGIFVDSAYQRAGYIEMVIRKVAPGESCAVTTSLTQPVDIARLPRTEGAIRYRERATPRECQ